MLTVACAYKTVGNSDRLRGGDTQIAYAVDAVGGEAVSSDGACVACTFVRDIVGVLVVVRECKHDSVLCVLVFDMQSFV